MVEKILGPVYTLGRLLAAYVKPNERPHHRVALFLKREAGHNLLSPALIFAGISMMDSAARAHASHDLIVFGLGVLARSMGSPNTK